MFWECCVIEKQWTLTQSGHEVVLAHLNCIFLHSIPPPRSGFCDFFFFFLSFTEKVITTAMLLKKQTKNRQQQKKTTKTREQSQRHCSDGAEQPKFTSFIHPFRYWNDLIFISSWYKTKLQFAKPERLTNCYILFLHFQFTFQVK